MFAQTYKGIERQIRDASRRVERQVVVDKRLVERARREPPPSPPLEEESPSLLRATLEGFRLFAEGVLREQGQPYPLLPPERSLRDFFRSRSGGVMNQPHLADERQRWNEYFFGLEGNLASSKLTAKQYGLARKVWSHAVEQTPRLRAPTAGLNADGDYYFDWKFRDLQGLTLTLNFTKKGLVDWFFRDKTNNVAVGTEEEPTEVVPGEVFTYLRLFQR